MANELQSLDVTKLVHYTEKIREIGELNKMLAPLYLRDFINAMDLTSSMLSKATKSNLDAKSALERVKAIAYLDKSEEYCRQKGIKMSNGIREAYVDLDEDVIKAKELYSASEAMCVFLKNKYQAFRCAHDDVKKISFNDAQGTGFEGF
jgi:uroporphyrinogen-III synthase